MNTKQQPEKAVASQNRKTKAQEREQLLDEIDQNHDWRQGQVHSRGGTALSSVDTCRICGLERRYFSDFQNGVSREYTFQFRGNPISLREAHQLDC
jgi:hypothetical protein